MSSSPFHADELDVQVRAGGGPRGAAIRDFMPDQHRSFFEGLRYVLVGVNDAQGWPLPTLLTGKPGFAHSPDPVTLRIESLPDARDPAIGSLRVGNDIAVLGIDLATRRRNRANGRIDAVDDVGLTIAVRQSFGNCPQYIQRRAAHWAASPSEDIKQTELLTSLDRDARVLIENADTFFVASHSRREIRAGGGADISHRGGRPGFVRVEGNTLTIPDFRGNRYFNTLGNLAGEPRASLLFIDFESGDLLQLQGLARIEWSEAPAHRLEGAERLWYFQVVRGWRRRAAAALRWSFVDFSPVLRLPTAIA